MSLKPSPLKSPFGQWTSCSPASRRGHHGPGIDVLPRSAIPTSPLPSVENVLRPLPSKSRGRQLEVRGVPRLTMFSMLIHSSPHRNLAAYAGSAGAVLPNVYYPMTTSCVGNVPSVSIKRQTLNGGNFVLVFNQTASRPDCLAARSACRRRLNATPTTLHGGYRAGSPAAHDRGRVHQPHARLPDVRAGIWRRRCPDDRAVSHGEIADKLALPIGTTATEYLETPQTTTCRGRLSVGWQPSPHPQTVGWWNKKDALTPSPL